MIGVCKIITFAFFLGFVPCTLTRLVDLSWDYTNNDTQFWPDVLPFTYTKKVATGGFADWLAMNEFCMSAHMGTHLDAPYHFSKEGWKIGDIPLNRLIAKGVVVDLSKVVEKQGRNTQLTAQNLEEWQQKNGKFEKGSVLLVKFGWSKYWTNPKKYLGTEIDGKPSFPSISPSAAEWITKSGKFYGVGVDCPSIDPGNSTDFESHRILTRNQLYDIENVKLTENLPSRGFTLLIMPMKMREGTGAPLRLLAVLKGTVGPFVF